MLAIWGDGGLSTYLKPVPKILLNSEILKRNRVTEMEGTFTTIPHAVQASVKVCNSSSRRILITVWSGDYWRRRDLVIFCWSLILHLYFDIRQGIVWLKLLKDVFELEMSREGVPGLKVTYNAILLKRQEQGPPAEGGFYKELLTMLLLQNIIMIYWYTWLASFSSIMF